MSPPPLWTRPFALAFGANFAMGLSFNLFLHLPGYLQELGADEILIGLLFGLTSLSAILARPAIGRQMDRRGRRAVIQAGAALNLLVCGLYLTLDTIGWWLALVRVTHGLAESMLFSALYTYAADIVPPARRTEGLALFGVSAIAPIMIAGILGDVILGRADYPALFLAATAFALPTLLAVLPLRDAARSPSPDPARGFRHSLAQSDLLPLWFAGTVFATALASVFTFIKTFVLETGAGTLGGFFAAYSLAAIGLRLFLGWLPDRVGPKRVLVPAMLTLALGLVLLALASGSAEVLAAGIFCGLGHGLTFPILSGMVVTRARDAERGASMAIFTAIFDAGALAGGPALGAVIRYAGYPAMFATAAALVTGGVGVFAVWDRGRR